MSAILALARRRTALLVTAEQGSTAIEYALIGSLIGLGILAGLTGTGTSVAVAFNGVMTLVSEALN